MSKTEDVKIIERLFDRDQAALDEITTKYNGLYKGILKQILNNDQDVCECENDVLLAVWNSIPPNCPDNLSAYICKLARNISINKFKYNNRAKRSVGYTVIIEELNDCIPDKSHEGNYYKIAEQNEINEVIARFVKSLDSETRVLFVRRYFYLETVASIAQKYKMSENRVSVKLFRARNKLHKMLEKEGIAI